MATEEDIFVDWKKNRFIIAPFEIMHNNDHIVVLTDIAFWSNKSDELISWCNQYNCTMQGMTVNIPTDDLLTVFCLQWS